MSSETSSTSGAKSRVSQYPGIDGKVLEEAAIISNGPGRFSQQIPAEGLELEFEEEESEGAGGDNEGVGSEADEPQKFVPKAYGSALPDESALSDDASASSDLRAFSPSRAVSDDSGETTPLIRSMTTNTTASQILRDARLSNGDLPFMKRPAVPMICAAIFLYCFSTGFLSAPEIQLIIEAVCSTTTPGNCGSNEVQQKNANVQRWCNLTSGITILIGGKIGQLSDIYGRRPAILFVLLCSAASKAAEFVVLDPQNYSMIYLIFTSSLDAIGGSLFVFTALANSYVVDVVSDNQRMQSVGRVSAYMNFGMGLGPLTSSLLSSLFDLDSKVLFQIGVAFSFLTFFLCWAFLPESRPMRLKKRSRRQSQVLLEAKKNSGSRIPASLSAPIDSIKSVRLLWITRYDSNGNLDIAARLNALYLIIINLIVLTCGMGFAVSEILYATFAFRWTVNNVSFFMGSTMLLRALVLLFFNPWLYDQLFKVLQKHTTSVDYIDFVYLLIAVVGDLLANIMCALANSTPVFMFSTVFIAFGSLALPTIHSSLVKYSNSSQNGEFFGAIAVITNIVALLAPLLGLSIYEASLNLIPKLIFYIAIALLSGGIVVTFLLRV